MSKTNFIVINGKKYNAATGEMIRNSQPAVETLKIQSEPTVKSMDGVARPSKQRLAARNTKKPVQKSATLMRRAVKKPSERISTNKNVVSSITKSSLQVKPQRLAHASTIQKSPHINKYGSDAPRSSVRKFKIAELPTKQHIPSEVEQEHITQNSTESSQINRVTSVAQSMIESALHSAESHTQQLLPEHTPEKKRLHHKLGISKKVARVATGSLAALLLIGFFALQNIPNLSMRVASARSGVNSSLPSYTPSGFAYQGPIDYSDGIVTVSFRSNSDNRQYTITQQNSAWTSDSLLNEFVATSTGQYQTYLDGRGRTLYIYDKNNATWVQDGVWYKVEGDSKLTTDQLARLAASM